MQKVLVFATKMGVLSKTWNTYGNKVSTVSDTAGRVPTIYVLSKNKKNELSETYRFYSREKLQYIT